MKSHPLKEAPLVRLTVSLMVGIVVGSHVGVSVSMLLAVLAGTVAVTLLLGRWARLQSVAIVVCMVILGLLLVTRQRQAMRVTWPKGEVVFEAVVLSEPVEKPKTMAVDLLLTVSQLKVKGYLYKDARSRGLHIGDGIRVQSLIEPLERKGYSGRTFVRSWNWQRAKVSLKHVSRLERTRLYFLKQRSRLLHRLSMHGLEGETYAVVAAMALGDKSALSKEMKDVYSLTGASHVLALSGLHLSIIYTLLSLLVTGRRWQMLSQLLIILSIWAFVFLVGMPVSVVRSAVMLSVYALMSLGHRDRMSVNTLAFTAMVMLMISPLSLYDVSFQLSFMAVLSILLFLPLADGLVSHAFLMRHRFLKWLWSLTAVSCAAQIGVAPLIAYYFGRLSTCFLLTNLIVIPATTLILYLSLTVLTVPSLAFMLIYVVDGLNGLLTWLAVVPGTSIGNLHPSLLQVWMTYVVIAALYWLVCVVTGFRDSRPLS